MKFIPLPFNTEMVQAEQAGRKSQTRRLKGLEKINKHPERYMADEFIDGLQWFEDLETLEDFSIKCPYGQVGDVIWVRETFANLNVDFPNTDPFFVYKADLVPANDYGPVTWKPNMYMPKAACRKWLQITNIRVERLQDISKQDAIAEGIEFSNLRTFPDYKDYSIKSNKHHEVFHYLNPILSFQSLWRSINGEQSWNDNPFVWVIEFTRIPKPENFI